MIDKKVLADRFEQFRPHLRGVAYRMLGSLAEAEDAVQEAWLKLDRTDSDAIDNLGGWLTTTVGRVCLDALRVRRSRSEDLDAEPPGDDDRAPADPEEEALLADSVGLAMLVVLDTLEPAERLAFVLHDMFAVPFDDVARVVDRSPAAARQLASRARRRVRGAGTPPPDVARQRTVVDAYLAAARRGDFDALLAILDPGAELRGTAGVLAVGAGIAEQAMVKRAASARAALVDGSVAIVVAPMGRLKLVLAVEVTGDRITGMRMISEPDELRALDISVLDG